MLKPGLVSKAMARWGWQPCVGAFKESARAREFARRSEVVVSGDGEIAQGTII